MSLFARTAFLQLCHVTIPISYLCRVWKILTPRENEIPISGTSKRWVNAATNTGMKGKSAIFTDSFTIFPQSWATTSTNIRTWDGLGRKISCVETKSFRCLNDSENVGKNSGVPKTSESKLFGVQQWQLQRQGNVSWPRKVFDNTKFWCSLPYHFTLPYHILPFPAGIQEQISQYFQLWYNLEMTWMNSFQVIGSLLRPCPSFPSLW